MPPVSVVPFTVLLGGLTAAPCGLTLAPPMPPRAFRCDNPVAVAVVEPPAPGATVFVPAAPPDPTLMLIDAVVAGIWTWPDCGAPEPRYSVTVYHEPAWPPFPLKPYAPPPPAPSKKTSR